MALKPATTPLVIALSQGSADAFVQGSVLTGLTGRQAYNVRSFQIELTNQAALSGSFSDWEIAVAITRRSKSAMPLLSDNDVLYKASWVCMSLTSGLAVFKPIEIYVPDLEVPIVEETIYAQLDSTGTTFSNTAVARMEVELDTMSDIDRLNLITRSLS